MVFNDDAEAADKLGDSALENAQDLALLPLVGCSVRVQSQPYLYAVAVHRAE